VQEGQVLKIMGAISEGKAPAAIPKADSCALTRSSRRAAN